MNTDADAIFFIDSSLNILDVNKSGLESWDLKRKDIVGKNLLNYIESGQKKSWENLLKEVLKTGRHFSLFGVLIPFHFGDRIVNIKVFKAGDGLGLIVTDITDQRKAETAWRQSEVRYRRLVENINEGILMQDKDGKITYVNEPFLEMIGYREDEVLGHKSTEFLGEGYLTKMKEKRAKRPENEWESYELAWKRKDGKQIYTSLSPKPLFDEKGRFNGSVSVLTDITERRQVEKELKQSRELLRNLSQYLQSVRERESKRIAREIHDVLGQQLTALKIDVSWLSHRVPSNKEEEKAFLAKAKAMSRLIDETIKAVQKISAELRPGLLDDLGLLPAIEWLSQDFQSRTNINCRTQFDCNELDLDPDLATAIFRISQEALTNIARHAKATRAYIKISERNGKLILKIQDNGRGIKESDVLSPTSLGLIGMRERLHPFSGELHIDGTPKKGTVINVILPFKD
jgi:two-component system sensor histidine kinase UhpB